MEAKDMNLSATELRIGSWVHQGEYGEQTVTAYNIHQFSLIPTGANVSDYYREWKPILLTEKWFIKLDFHKEIVSSKFIKDGLIIFLDKDFQGWQVIMTDIFNDGKSVYLCPIYYVHQLQNLYFVLRDKELIENDNN